MNPEKEHWRRGVEASVIYNRLHGDLKVPFTYRVPGGQEKEPDHEGEGQGGEGEGAREVWPASLAAFPLGQRIADARRHYARGRLDPGRIRQLEALGMIWSHRDVAWEEGLTAARGWATENGHLLAPLDAVYRGHKVGIWLKNARADTRAGTLAPERCEQLEDIDPAWCPTWPVEWQRAFHLVRRHLDAGGTLQIMAAFQKPLSFAAFSAATVARADRCAVRSEQFAAAARGELETVVHEVLPLDGAVLAHQKMAAGEVFGRIVLTP
ncbi:Helicase associated domain protein [Streptomyces sp. NPDC055966]|uniref:Helicase associated domain protein n=1 Tax=Streptomyces sp. NPDC055966 TaxID=3345669 RepID=UPI0035E1E040